MKMFVFDGTETDAAWNLAMEEYAFETLSRENSYLLLWQNANTVVIGRHQDVYAEVNLSYVNQHGISVVRRLSGGGAVYHDLGNLNYTIITSLPTDKGQDVFQYTEPILKVLSNMGIVAEKNGRNDLVIGGKKFSGNASYQKGDRLLFHGTLLFQTDLDEMEKVLRVEPLKQKHRGVPSVRSRVTNLRDHEKCCMELAEFRNIILKEITRNYDWEIAEWTEQDKKEIEAICRSRYGNNIWNYGKSNQLKGGVKHYVEGCGLVKIQICVENECIASIRFSGDFFHKWPVEELQKQLIGCKLEREILKSYLEKIPVSNYLVGMDRTTLGIMILQAAKNEKIGNVVFD